MRFLLASMPSGPLRSSPPRIGGEPKNRRLTSKHCQIQTDRFLTVIRGDIMPDEKLETKSVTNRADSDFIQARARQFLNLSLVHLGQVAASQTTESSESTET